MQTRGRGVIGCHCPPNLSMYFHSLLLRMEVLLNHSVHLWMVGRSPDWSDSEEVVELAHQVAAELVPRSVRISFGIATLANM